MVKVKDLAVGLRNVTVEGNIIAKSEPYPVNTKFGEKQMCSATLEDDTGIVTLKLWEKEVNAFNVGDSVKIINPWIQKYKDNLEITKGKFGRIEKKV